MSVLEVAVSEEQRTEVELDAKNLRGTIRSSNLGAIASFLTLLLVALIAAGLWLHMGDQKDANKAMKELTSALRENNCLQRYSGQEKIERADFCKQISQQFIY